MSNDQWKATYKNPQEYIDRKREEKEPTGLQQALGEISIVFLPFFGMFLFMFFVSLIGRACS